MKEKEKYYEFTGETRKYNGKTLSRVRCTRKFRDDVNVGDVGGWIEHERNLEGGWVKDEAIVCDGGAVCDDAILSGRAIIRDQACATGRSHVGDEVEIKDRVVVCGAEIGGNIVLCGCMVIGDDARVTTEDDYCVVNPVRNIDGGVVAYRTKLGGVIVSDGEDEMSLSKFEEHVEEVYRVHSGLVKFLKAKFGTPSPGEEGGD